MEQQCQGEVALRELYRRMAERGGAPGSVQHPAVQQHIVCQLPKARGDGQVGAEWQHREAHRRQPGLASAVSKLLTHLSPSKGGGRGSKGSQQGRTGRAVAEPRIAPPGGHEPPELAPRCHSTTDGSADIPAFRPLSATSNIAAPFLAAPGCSSPGKAQLQVVRSLRHAAAVQPQQKQQQQVVQSHSQHQHRRRHQQPPQEQPAQQQQQQQMTPGHSEVSSMGRAINAQIERSIADMLMATPAAPGVIVAEDEDEEESSLGHVDAEQHCGSSQAASGSAGAAAASCSAATRPHHHQQGLHGAGEHSSCSGGHGRCAWPDAAMPVPPPQPAMLHTAMLSESVGLELQSACTPVFMSTRSRAMYCDIDDPSSSIVYPKEQRHTSKLRRWMASLFGGCFVPPPDSRSPMVSMRSAQSGHGMQGITSPQVQPAFHMEPLRQSLVDLALEHPQLQATLVPAGTAADPAAVNRTSGGGSRRHGLKMSPTRRLRRVWAASSPRKASSKAGAASTVAAVAAAAGAATGAGAPGGSPLYSADNMIGLQDEEQANMASPVLPSRPTSRNPSCCSTPRGQVLRGGTASGGGSEQQLPAAGEGVQRSQGRQGEEAATEVAAAEPGAVLAKRNLMDALQSNSEADAVAQALPPHQAQGGQPAGQQQQQPLPPAELQQRLPLAQLQQQAHLQQMMQEAVQQVLQQLPVVALVQEPQAEAQQQEQQRPGSWQRQPAHERLRQRPWQRQEVPPRGPQQQAAKGGAMARATHLSLAGLLGPGQQLGRPGSAGPGVRTPLRPMQALPPGAPNSGVKRGREAMDVSRGGSSESEAAAAGGTPKRRDLSKPAYRSDRLHQMLSPMHHCSSSRGAAGYGGSGDAAAAAPVVAAAGAHALALPGAAGLGGGSQQRQLAVVEQAQAAVGPHAVAAAQAVLRRSSSAPTSPLHGTAMLKAAGAAHGGRQLGGSGSAPSSPVTRGLDGQQGPRLNRAALVRTRATQRKLHEREERLRQYMAKSPNRQLRAAAAEGLSLRAAAALASPGKTSRQQYHSPPPHGAVTAVAAAGAAGMRGLQAPRRHTTGALAVARNGTPSGGSRFNAFSAGEAGTEPYSAKRQTFEKLQPMAHGCGGSAVAAATAGAAVWAATAAAAGVPAAIPGQASVLPSKQAAPLLRIAPAAPATAAAVMPSAAAPAAAAVAPAAAAPSVPLAFGGGVDFAKLAQDRNGYLQMLQRLAEGQQVERSQIEAHKQPTLPLLPADLLSGAPALAGAEMAAAAAATAVPLAPPGTYATGPAQQHQQWQQVADFQEVIGSSRTAGAASTDTLHYSLTLAMPAQGASWEQASLSSAVEEGSAPPHQTVADGSHGSVQFGDNVLFGRAATPTESSPLAQQRMVSMTTAVAAQGLAPEEAAAAAAMPGAEYPYPHPRQLYHRHQQVAVAAAAAGAAQLHPQQHYHCQQDVAAAAAVAGTAHPHPQQHRYHHQGVAAAQAPSAAHPHPQQRFQHHDQGAAAAPVAAAGAAAHPHPQPHYHGLPAAAAAAAGAHPNPQHGHQHHSQQLSGGSRQESSRGHMSVATRSISFGSAACRAHPAAQAEHLQADTASASGAAVDPARAGSAAQQQGGFPPPSQAGMDSAAGHGAPDEDRLVQLALLIEAQQQHGQPLVNMRQLRAAGYSEADLRALKQWLAVQH